ncbi:hypothetical protein [Bifidobacterium porcinum]|uniref:hypothetical protein n=1 Tax=Bifidobacterium porcinum TaxID=212365 RepID=UPI003993DC60
MRTSDRRATRFYISVIVMAVLGGTALVAAVEGAFPIALATAAMLVPASATAAVLFARDADRRGTHADGYEQE